MSEVSAEDKISAKGRIDRSKNRILVVDDDKIILEIFRRILEMEGFDVDTAETGKQTLEKVSRRPSIDRLGIIEPTEKAKQLFPEDAT